MHSRAFQVIAAIGLALVLALPVKAQFESGSVVGSIKDSTGAIVLNATVDLRNIATNVTRTTISNSAGEFDFVNVAPGKYEVKTHQQGFTDLQRYVDVAVGARLELDLSLTAGAAAQTIDVNANSNAVVIETSASDIGNLTTQQQVVDLPLNSRNFTQLVSLSPGVNLRGTSNNSLQGGYTSGRGANGAVVNGNPAEDTVFLFDGIQSVNNDVAVPIFFPPVDAIQEFRVQTSGAPAAYGGAPAIINLSFKSGTNKLHGTVYEFVRNSAFDAKNYFDSHTNPIAPFHMNQFGANIGGPVVIPHILNGRDKLFFFADYEGKRMSQAQTYISTVPTAAFQTGDFSALLPSQQLMIPGTTTPLPGNIVPMADQDPAAQKLIKLFPLPNIPGATIANNYLYNPVLTVRVDQGDLRMDYRSDKTSAFGRFSKENPVTFTPGYLPSPAIGGGPSRPGTTPVPGEQIVLGYGRTLGGTKYYEARLGWSRLNEQIVIANEALGSLSTQYGIPNANGSQPGLANFAIIGQVGLGDGFGNLTKIDNNWELNQAFSFSKGAHEVKIGAVFQSRRQVNYDPLYPVGHYVFNGVYTGYGLADFLYGHSTNSEIDSQPLTSLLRFTPSFYIQDTWRVTPKLTLNYGLRNDLVTPWKERRNRMSGFVPGNSGALIPVGTAPFQNGAVTDGRYTNFGPRFGFAYTVNSKTSIRGGFGIYYAFENIASGQNEAVNAPFIGSYTTTSASGLEGYNAAPTISQGFPLEYPLASSTILYYPRSFKNATSNEYNLDIERQISRDDVLSIAYVGQTATHVLVQPFINQPVPGAGAITARRPYPNFATIQEICMCANSAYSALQASYRAHIGNSLDFLGSYTYGHSIDDSSGSGNTVAPQDPYHFNLTYRGNSDFDIRHAASLSWTYTLPIGRGQPFFGKIGEVPNLLVGGWQINSIETFQTGVPFTPTLSTSLLNNGGAVQYPDRIGSGKLAHRSVSKWFDTSAFACPGTTTPIPASGCVGPNYNYGNSGRNILYGPGTKQVDVSAFKNFIFNHDGTRYLQIRGEAFNVLNTPQFNNPATTLGSLSTPAGAITSAGSPLLFQRTSRQIQLAGKLYF